MDWKLIEDKIVPWVIIILIGASFTMYMDVQFLKATASDYKNRADKAHKTFHNKLEVCEKNGIIHSKDIEFLYKRIK